MGERLPGGWDTATWAQPPVLSASSIPHVERRREAVSLSDPAVSLLPLQPVRTFLLSLLQKVVVVPRTSRPLFLFLLKEEQAVPVHGTRQISDEATRHIEAGGR